MTLCRHQLFSPREGDNRGRAEDEERDQGGASESSDLLLPGGSRPRRADATWWLTSR